MRRTTYDKVARSGPDANQMAPHWAVHCNLESHLGPVDIGTGIKPRNGAPDLQRRVQLNGAAAKASDMLLDYVRVLWLTPSMNGLFTGGKADAALAASIFHFKEIAVPDLKSYLKTQGIPIRIEA